MERKENCSSENALYYARILFVWFCLLGHVGHVVAKRLKVEVETPGTLPELVGKEAKYKVTDLTLKGTLNGRDLCFLREMAGRDKERQSTPGHLRVLDMRDVSFARGGGGYVRHGEWREVQEEHTLPPYLFSECGLTHIDLPERLDTIAEGALGATRISRIVLPEDVLVGASAFYGSSELAEVVFPRQARGVWKGAFEGCAQLKTLSLNHVDFISGGAFQRMSAVERIEVNGDVGQLDGWRTFAECPQLKRVDFRGVVLGTGGPTLLADCPRLEQVVFHGDILSTGLGAAEHCPLFEGYTVKGKVLRSQHKDFVPQVSDEERPEGRGWADFMSRFAPVVHRIWAHGGEVMGYMKKASTPWFYHSACAWASEGRDEEALAHLDIAIKLGFAKYDLIKGGKEWDALRENPEFQALVEKVRAVGDYLYVLKKSPAYRGDTRPMPAFTYQSATDSNLVRVRRYFNLDSIAGDGDEISQIKNLMYWLHDAIRHDGGSMWPDCVRNSIAMYELCKREGRGLNCRFLAQVLSEMYLAMGFPSRFVTCQSKAYDTDTDCHVINMVWSRQLGKWIWMDASFAAYVTDENGLLLHPGEVRERLIKGLPLVLNEDANWNHKTKQTKEGYLENYMAKNLYMLDAHLESRFETEPADGSGSPQMYLVPEGFWPLSGHTTYDDRYFWQAP